MLEGKGTNVVGKLGVGKSGCRHPGSLIKVALMHDVCAVVQLESELLVVLK